MALMKGMRMAAMATSILKMVCGDLSDGFTKILRGWRICWCWGGGGGTRAGRCSGGSRCPGGGGGACMEKKRVGWGMKRHGQDTGAREALPVLVHVWISIATVSLNVRR